MKWGGGKRRRQSTTRRRQRGGAYIDLPSFGGDVHTSSAAMDGFNTKAGGFDDPTTAGAVVDTRLGGALAWNWQ